MKNKINTLLVMGAASALITGASGETASKAQAPTFQINGNTIMNIYVAKQKNKTNGKDKAPHFANDISDLYFLISGTTASGIEYKYKINFQAVSNASPTISQNYVEFVTKAGTFQFGNVVGPEDSMIRDGGSILGGVGVFDGPFYKVFNLPTLVMRGNDVIGDTGYATKLAYYSPSFYGFRLGVAYTPDTTHLGEAGQDNQSVKKNTRVPGQRTYFFKTEKGINVIGQNNWAFGLSFDQEWGNFGFALNGAYVMDRSYLAATDRTIKRLRLKNTSAYQLGTVLGYKFDNGYLLQLGGGYLNSGRSRLLKAPLKDARKYGFGHINGDGMLYKGNAGQSWNIGSALTMGAYKLGAAFQETQRKIDANEKARNRMVSLTGDVVPVAGLKFYSEVDIIKAKSTEGAYQLAKRNNATFKEEPVRSNHGMVVTIGTKLSF